MRKAKKQQEPDWLDRILDEIKGKKERGESQSLAYLLEELLNEPMKRLLPPHLPFRPSILPPPGRGSTGTTRSIGCHALKWLLSSPNGAGPEKPRPGWSWEGISPWSRPWRWPMKTILLVGFAALFLGMRLPVTASYIVLVILAGPALMELGMAMLTVHMLVFWYNQTANVTPTCSPCSLCWCRCRGSDPMKTGFASCKAAVGLYIIPILMAYRPLLLNSYLVDIIIATVSSILKLIVNNSSLRALFALLMDEYYGIHLAIFCLFATC